MIDNFYLDPCLDRLAGNKCDFVFNKFEYVGRTHRFDVNTLL